MADPKEMYPNTYMSWIRLSSPVGTFWLEIALTQRAYDAIITLLWRQNDVATSCMMTLLRRVSVGQVKTRVLIFDDKSVLVQVSMVGNGLMASSGIKAFTRVNVDPIYVGILRHNVFKVTCRSG